MDKHHDIQHCAQAIQHMTAGIAYCQLYFDDHPQVIDAVDQTFQEVSNMVSAGRSITMACIGRVLIINETPMKNDGPVIKKFLQILNDKKIDGITFLPGVTRDEIRDMIKVFASTEKKTFHSLPHITFGTLATDKQRTETQFPGEFMVLDLSEEHQDDADRELPPPPDLNRLKQAFEELRAKPDKSIIKELTYSVELFMKGFSRSIHPMMYLSSLKSFDEYTFVHSINVFMLTTTQAEFLGFRGQQLYDIGVASVLHDVGKLFISDDIINKPDVLTPEERRIMQTHPLKGARYLMEVSEISRLASICAMDHHILFDGSGYPGLKRWRPNIVSQMITISDAFDAMRSRRPYQEPKSQERVIRTLKQEKGRCFNPVLVDNFLNLLGRALIKKDETE